MFIDLLDAISNWHSINGLLLDTFPLPAFATRLVALIFHPIFCSTVGLFAISICLSIAIIRFFVFVYKVAYQLMTGPNTDVIKYYVKPVVLVIYWSTFMVGFAISCSALAVSKTCSCLKRLLKLAYSRNSTMGKSQQAKTMVKSPQAKYESTAFPPSYAVAVEHLAQLRYESSIDSEIGRAIHEEYDEEGERIGFD